MYKVIKSEQLKNQSQYRWFKTFANPCYGLNVKMDVSEVVKYSKETKTSFFVNILYLITTALNSIEEFKIREVKDEIRIYDTINPTFTVMTDVGIYENAGFKMVDDYQTFYKTAREIIDKVKKQTSFKQTYNDSMLFDDYYMTCLPWICIEGMTHPLCENNNESLTVPRLCWDKYRIENGKYVMLLNITVSHCYIDGYTLSKGFAKIQENFDQTYSILK
jgi:chloramphenicol O-acetyltransferase type A